MAEFDHQNDELDALLPDLSFVSDLEAETSRCNVCQNIVLYHSRATCGHLFCTSCLAKIRYNQCPVVKCKNKSVWAPKVEALRSKLQVLKVFCVNRNYGCEEIVSLADILEHKKNCRFFIENLLPRVYFEKRSEEWDFKNSDITTGRSKSDDRIRAEQDFRHELLTEVRQLKQHFNERLDQIMSEFSVKLQEARRRQILDIEERLAKEIAKQTVAQSDQLKKTAMLTYQKLDLLLERFISQINRSNADDQKIRDKDSLVSMELLDKEIKMHNKLIIWSQHIMDDSSVTLVWTLPSVASKLKELRNGRAQLVSSKIFKPQKYDLQVQAHLKPNFTRRCFGIYFTFHSNQPNAWYRFRVSLQDQSSGGVSKRDVWRVIDTAFDMKQQMQEVEMWGMPNFAPVRFFEKESPYVSKDQVLVKMVLAPCFILNKYVFLDEGILLWKFDSYRQKKSDSREGISNEWPSPDFYSSGRGYKLEIYLEFTESGVEFSQVCLKGGFDEGLQPLFPHQTTLQVFDQTQTGEQRHLTKVVATDKLTHKIGEANYNEIEDDRYMRDDCLVIKVTVKPKP